MFRSATEKEALHVMAVTNKLMDSIAEMEKLGVSPTYLLAGASLLVATIAVRSRVTVEQVQYMVECYLKSAENALEQEEAHVSSVHQA